MTLSSVRIGSAGSGGSCSSTSRPAPAMPALLQHLRQRLLIDDRSARGVDEKGGRLHQREPFGIDEMAGLRRQRAVHR